eukprot:4444708-Amphidinium_carterae.1
MSSRPYGDGAVPRWRDRYSGDASLTTIPIWASSWLCGSGYRSWEGLAYHSAASAQRRRLRAGLAISEALTLHLPHTANFCFWPESTRQW